MAQRSSSAEDNEGTDASSNSNSNTGLVDPQLWHACAGSQVLLPPVGSSVIYFPQGHAEHAALPSAFLLGFHGRSSFACRVLSVKFLADRETDEVYAKVRLQPEADPEASAAVDESSSTHPAENHHHHHHQGKLASFAKTLTQSDANNGGGFSVPRYCAETIFPRLDYKEDPPVQIVHAKDVHGKVWQFRHIYRGTPRRHLLTTGWSNFVNQKKLVAGDAIVFLRTVAGELCVGVRRATKGIGRNDHFSSSLSSPCSTSWHPLASSVVSSSMNPSSKLMDGPYKFLEDGAGFPSFPIPKPGSDRSSSITSSPSSLNHQIAVSIASSSVNWSSKLMDSNGTFLDNVASIGRTKPEILSAPLSGFSRNQARITAESVVEAVTLAEAGEAFEVVYYPRSMISEFFVKAQTVRTSLQQRWGPGLRFKMAVETDDASRVSWFVGTVAKVGEIEPARWPNSPWKILQVTWDEPDLLQGISRVSPWQVEIVSPIQLPLVSFPKKKLRFSQPSEVQFNGQGYVDLSVSSLVSHMQGSISTWHQPIECVPLSMQGARQDQNYGPTIQPMKCQPVRSLLRDFYQPGESLAEDAGGSIVPEELYERDFFSQRCPSNQSDISTSLAVRNNSCSQLTNVASSNRDGSLGDKSSTFMLFGKAIEMSADGSKSPDSISHDSAPTVKIQEVCNNRIAVRSNEVDSSTFLPGPKQPFSCSQGAQEMLAEARSKYCRVYNEGDDVDRSVDISSLNSFEELYERLETMFGADKCQFLNRLIYFNAMGFSRSVGKEPYCEFSRNVQRLKILPESSSESATK